MTFRRAFNLFAAASAAIALASCAATAAKPEGAAPAASVVAEGSLAWAIAGDWRKPEDAARDAARHPVQTLEFFGVKPGMTVVELSPGSGWWTDILAPYLTKNGGTLIAGFGDPVNGSPAGIEARNAFAARMQANPAVYGSVRMGQFGPRAGAIAEPGTADLVMSMRGFHGLRIQNWTDKALNDIKTVLKPGGILAIEAHRGNGPIDGSQGYLPQQFVIDTVTAAGFELVSSSEINANPRDTADHPFGVWTLPPTRQSAPRGQPDNPNFDHSKYDAIGESDRMTLIFRKK
jgi:predicted methyltransferase